jgi:CAAX protease family protein
MHPEALLLRGFCVDTIPRTVISFLESYMSQNKKDSTEREQHRRKPAWYALFALVAFVAIDHLGDLLHQLDLRRYLPCRVILALRNTLEVAFSILGVALAHRRGVKFAVQELGMTAPIKPALIFAAIASAPMLIAFAIGFSINREMTFLSVAVGCFIAPFAEEVLFRGYLFRQLYQRAKMGFWLSALIPSVLFAAGHAYQSTHFGDLAGILAITSLGSVLLCWLYRRWSYNLWVVVALHGVMNLWWEVFAVDDTALGGWLANGARFTTVAVAILLTIFKDRFWKRVAVANEPARDGKERAFEDHVDLAVATRPLRLTARPASSQLF